jgi:hypothetical protein
VDGVVGFIDPVRIGSRRVGKAAQRNRIESGQDDQAYGDIAGCHGSIICPIMMAAALSRAELPERLHSIANNRGPRGGALRPRADVQKHLPVAGLACCPSFNLARGDSISGILLCEMTAEPQERSQNRSL